MFKCRLRFPGGDPKGGRGSRRDGGREGEREREREREGALECLIRVTLEIGHAECLVRATLPGLRSRRFYVRSSLGGTRIQITPARHPNSEAKRRMCAVHSAEYRLTPPIIQLASNHHHVSIRSNLDSSGSGSASGGCSNDGLEWERERKRWPMHVHDNK